MSNPEMRGLKVLLVDESVTWHWLPEDFKPSDTPETDPTTSPDTPPQGTRPNNKEIA